MPLCKLAATFVAMLEDDGEDRGFNGNVLAVAFLAVLFVVLFCLSMWILDAIK